MADQRIESAPNQTYGKRKEQEDSQRVVAMHKEQNITPGQMGLPNRPSEKPSEPLTAGAAIGAGPGPDILPQPMGSPDNELSERLASYLPILEAKAAMPEATANFRMFVRRVRHASSKSSNSPI
ncbi:MAG: hypothetical protein CMG34_07800 [Candidatus Marinimicrobia bacterium]|nr:hypothetical protein [Candidatus Neomarinimicrobiota bacterium]|tara:strand:+ start:3096 stop:3467 length:372 start_codon:yes stop_codon:yes gene_type:complete